METIDDETCNAAVDFIQRQARAGKPFFVWWNGTRMHLYTHVRQEYRGRSGISDHVEHVLRMVDPACVPGCADARHRGPFRRDVQGAPAAPEAGELLGRPGHGDAEAAQRRIGPIRPALQGRLARCGRALP
jgi:hypothetical protein